MQTGIAIPRRAAARSGPVDLDCALCANAREAFYRPAPFYSTRLPRTRLVETPNSVPIGCRVLAGVDGQLLNEVELQRLEALLGQLDGSATAAEEPEPEPEPSWAGPPALVSVAIHAQAGDETACVVRISTSPLRPSSPVAEPVEAVAADLDAKALVQINANGGSGEECRRGSSSAQ